jgi:tetratricopeptide (TPR) repeat protein
MVTPGEDMTEPDGSKEESPAAAVKHAYTLRNAGRRDEAIEAFRSIVAAMPDCREAYVGWETCAEGDELLAATRARLEAFAVETEEELGWWLERLCMSGPAALKSIVLVLDRMASIYADSPIMFFARARVSMWNDDPASAAEALFQVVAHQPDTDGAWLRAELEEYEELAALIDTEAFALLMERVDALRRA